MKILVLSLIIVLIHTLKVNAYQGMSISPVKKDRIVWDCQESDKCNIYTVNANGKINWVEQKHGLSEPRIIWHSDDLAEIRIRCGAPCWYAFYYDGKNGVSKPYEFAVAVNAKKRVIAVAEDPYIVLYNIFDKEDKPFMKFKIDFSKGALLVTAVEKAYFDKKGNLIIYYKHGEDFITKRKTIKIRYPEAKK